MLEVIKQLDDPRAEEKVVAHIEKALHEVKAFLPHLGADPKIYFDNFCLIEEYGCGGFAYSPEILTIAFDLDYAEKEQQLKYLRETVFHEVYHLAQGYTSETFHGAPLEEAIYEGAATVFERDRAGAKPGYADYDTEKAKTWLDQIEKLTRDYDRDSWKFFDPADHERWKLYKTGVYVVDEYLKHNPKNTIEDMNRLTAEEILEGSETLDG